MKNTKATDSELPEDFKLTSKKATELSKWKLREIVRLLPFLFFFFFFFFLY
jgi:hypothetical protein